MKIKKFFAIIISIVLALCTLSFVSACSGENENEVTVTFNLNYDGATGAPAAQTIQKGETATEPVDPSRSGYDFSGWYREAACASGFDFSTPVESDMTLYAGWLDNSVNYIEVTFDYNYEGASAPYVQHVAEGEKVVKPADPVSDAGQFAGWTTAADGGDAFDFDAAPTENVTVYAQWSVCYVFEAEYTDLSGIKPCGWSGSPSDPLATIAYSEDETLGASNDRFLSFLYREGTTVEFVIESDRDVADATIAVRLSAEGGKDFSLASALYTIEFNDTPLEYDEIKFEGVPALPDFLPFRDYVVQVNASLQKGANVIRFITSNNVSMGGTTAAIAPCIDCLKVTTAAKLSWEPILSNLEGGLD